MKLRGKLRIVQVIDDNNVLMESRIRTKVPAPVRNRSAEPGSVTPVEWEIKEHPELVWVKTDTRLFRPA